MSNFKRLANLARGKVKSLLTPSHEGSDATAALDRELKEAPPPETRRHQILQQLRENGLLSDEEYRTKKAALDGDDAPGETPDEPQKDRTPPTPKKRTL